MEAIVVKYKPVWLEGSPWLHKYIVYTDKFGKQWAARGDQGNHNIRGIFGTDLITEIGPYEKGEFADWAPRGAHETETIATGADLSQEWQSVVAAMRRVHDRQYPYHPRLQNSNTAADWALEQAGLRLPTKYGGGLVGKAPGSGPVFTLPPSPDEIYYDEKGRRIVPIPRPRPTPSVESGRSSLLSPPQSASKLARATEHIIPTRGMIGEGAQHAAVLEIQRFLNTRGITGADGKALPVNGMFDETTRAAIEAYQARRPTLLQDGIVGLRTLGAMLRDEGPARRARGVTTTIAAGGSNGPPPRKADAAEDRALQFAHELGERLGRSLSPGGRAVDVDFAFGFKPSPETGDIDPDALEVSTAITVPHSVDRGLPHAALNRDGAIIYTALRGASDVMLR